MLCNALKCPLCRSHAVHLKKPSNSQILLHPIPYPTAIAAPIFPGIPCPTAQKHKKGRPTRDALFNSDLFSAVSVPCT